MTGKELLLVLAGTAAAAGAGGVGAAAIVSDKGAETGTDPALLAQLEKLGDSLEGTNRIMSDSRAEIASLKSRIEGVESGLRGARAVRRAPSGRERIDASRLASTDAEIVASAEGGEETFSTSHEGLPDEVQAHLREALGKLGAELKGLELGGSPMIHGSVLGADGDLIGGLTDVNGHLKGLTKSFELRRLPEEERWAKARDEVGLTRVQEDEIRAALAERDQAIEESMKVERDEEDGNTRISIRSMDFAKTSAANEAYRKRVDNTLNHDQKKSWRESGYDNAFGKGAMGSATVISIGRGISTDETNTPR